MAGLEFSPEDLRNMEFLKLDPDHLNAEELELWVRTTPQTDEIRPVNYSEDSFEYGGLSPSTEVDQS